MAAPSRRLFGSQYSLEQNNPAESSTPTIRYGVLIRIIPTPAFRMAMNSFCRACWLIAYINDSSSDTGATTKKCSGSVIQ